MPSIWASSPIRIGVNNELGGRGPRKV
jgi:hypothetical protein